MAEPITITIGITTILSSFFDAWGGGDGIPNIPPDVHAESGALEYYLAIRDASLTMEQWVAENPDGITIPVLGGTITGEMAYNLAMSQADDTIFRTEYRIANTTDTDPVAAFMNTLIGEGVFLFNDLDESHPDSGLGSQLEWPVLSPEVIAEINAAFGDLFELAIGATAKDLMDAKEAAGLDPLAPTPTPEALAAAGEQAAAEQAATDAAAAEQAAAEQIEADRVATEQAAADAEAARVEEQQAIDFQLGLDQIEADRLNEEALQRDVAEIEAQAEADRIAEEGAEEELLLDFGLEDIPQIINQDEDFVGPPEPDPTSPDPGAGEPDTDEQFGDFFPPDGDISPEDPVLDVDGNEIAGPNDPFGDPPPDSIGETPVADGTEGGGSFDLTAIIQELFGLDTPEEAQEMIDGIGGPILLPNEGDTGTDEADADSAPINFLDLILGGAEAFMLNQAEQDRLDFVTEGIDVPVTDVFVEDLSGGGSAAIVGEEEQRVATFDAGGLEQFQDDAPGTISAAGTLIDDSIGALGAFDGAAWLATAREAQQPFIDRLIGDNMENLFNTGRLGSTGGALQSEALFNAIINQDKEFILESENQARLFAENERANLAAGTGVTESLVGSSLDITGSGLDLAEFGQTVATQGTNTALGGITESINATTAGVNAGSASDFWSDIIGELADSDLLDQAVDFGKDLFGF